MPRRYRKKKSYRKKRGSKRPSRSLGSAVVAGLGGFALKLLKRKLGLNTETHYADYIDTAAATSTTYSLVQTSIGDIAIGDSVSTRTGRSIRVTSLRIRGTIRADPDAVTGYRVRIVVYTQPKIVGGTLLVPGDIMEDHTAQINSPYDMNAEGFRILQDKTYNIAKYGQDGDVKTWTFTYSPLSHHMEWTSADTTGSKANLLRGMIRVMVATDAVTGQEPTLESYARLKWVDN